MRTIYPPTHFRYKPKVLIYKKSKVSVGVYLDNAASTPTDPVVKREMTRVMDIYGNPSSFNNSGREARKLLEESRLKIARFIGAKPEEIILTSSGSEANNMAVFGLAGMNLKPAEIITTPIEHPSVLESLKSLSNKGWKITYLKVDKDGFIDLNELKSKLNSEVKLVSIIYANNEIGTIQPIRKAAEIVKNFGNIYFHVDSCQATEYLEMNVNNLGVDLMTFNGSKIYGPKGIGVLYKKRGIKLSPIIYGGSQEHGLRAGTENLPAIAGLAKSLSLINKKESVRASKLRDYFLNEIKRIIPEARINGPSGNGRLPNNINISVRALASENLLLELDKYGISASSGSACTSHSVEPSHVLKAIGVESKYLNGALRFSLGRNTTKKDIDYVLQVLPKVIEDLNKRYRK